MKKWLVFVLLSVVLVSFVFAENGDGPPDIPVDEDIIKGVETVQETVPLDESGQFDPSKLEGPKSLAEARIEGINSWLDENVAWLKFIFRMKPEISWLFAINLYIMLFFLVSLVLEGHTLWLFIQKKSMAQVFGLIVYVILLVTNLFLAMAKFFHSLITTWWGIAILIIAFVVAAVLEKYYIQVMEKYIENKNKNEAAFNREILKKTVNPLK